MSRARYLLVAIDGVLADPRGLPVEDQDDERMAGLLRQLLVRSRNLIVQLLDDEDAERVREWHDA